MPKDKSTGKKLADMMYGNPEGAAFGITPMIGKRREDRQDREAAKSFPVDLARGVVAGAVGLPGDIESLARLPYELITGNESPTFLPTSEDVLKRIPFGTNTPAGQFASGLGTLAGGSANLGAIPRAVKAAPGALKTATRNISAPRTLNPQAGVVRIGESPDFLPAVERETNRAKFLEPSKVKQKMFHATNADIKAFRPSHRGAHFVTPDRDFANQHIGDDAFGGVTDDFQEGANVMPVYVNAENPFDYENLQDLKNLFRRAQKDGLNLDRDWKQMIMEGDWNAIENKKVQQAIKNLGHDSFYVTERLNDGEPIKNLGVFRPEQIKSAIGNRGTYDIEDPDITKAEGGSVQFSDNPDVMQLELAAGGAVRMQAGGIAKLAKLARAPAKSKQEIQAIAERMAPQVTGEYVRESAKSAKTVAGKTQKQFQREKTLPVDVRATAEERVPQPVDIEKLKDEVMIGIPGDPTLAGKTLYGVGDVRLGSPSPQHGGPLYGLYNDPNFWASGEDAAKKVQNLARSVSELYDSPVLGNYIMMGPDSLSYAQHFADANLQAIDLSKMTKQQIEMFNEIIREGYNYKKKGERFQRVFPSFPGIEDKDSAYLHMAMDPDLRKHFNEVMQKPTVTEPLNLPSGQDIRFAITEPALRDMESGVTGYSIGRMRPDVPSEGLKLSQHPTYSHDIPGQFMGTSKYPMPYELTFPDTVKSIRENPRQAPYEFGTLQYGSTHQTIDQQMIDEIKAYEERMKQLTGKKAGGAVRKAAGGEITADDLILEERKL